VLGLLKSYFVRLSEFHEHTAIQICFKMALICKSRSLCEKSWRLLHPCGPLDTFFQPIMRFRDASEDSHVLTRTASKRVPLPPFLVTNSLALMIPIAAQKEAHGEHIANYLPFDSR